MENNESNNADMATENESYQEDALQEDDNDFIESLPAGSMGNAYSIPVKYLFTSPNQPRLHIDQDDLSELAASVKEVGILEPLLVAKRGRRRYFIVAGHRRLEAAKLNDIETVPCIILDIEDEEILQHSLIENLQRADLAPFEEALGLQQLIAQYKLTYRDAATKLGKSSTWVNDRLLLLALSPALKSALEEGKISLKKAIELHKIPNPTLQMRLLKKAEDMTLDELKEVIDEEISRVRSSKGGKKDKNALPYWLDFKEKAEGVKVSKDRLSIKFEDREQLIKKIQDILDELLRAEE